MASTERLWKQNCFTTIVVNLPAHSSSSIYSIQYLDDCIDGSLCYNQKNDGAVHISKFILLTGLKVNLWH